MTYRGGAVWRIVLLAGAFIVSGCDSPPAPKSPTDTFSRDPNRKLIDTDVWAVLGVDTPTYYTDGAYWSFGRGRWYRATEWHEAFEPVLADAVPETILNRPHWKYAGLEDPMLQSRTQQPQPGFISDATRVDRPFIEPAAATLGGGPDMRLIQPGTGIYVVVGAETSAYYAEGRYWYPTSGEWWYVSDDWGGPRRRVDVMDVPPELRSRPRGLVF